MHHVLTIPRVRRRHDEAAAAWVPVAVPAPDAAESVEAPAAAATRQVVRRIDGVGIGSVVKLALLFYGSVFACLAGGVLIVWIAISTMGYVHRFEDFMQSIGFRGFAVSSQSVVFGLIGVAGSLTLLATFLTVMVASAYNLVGSVGHGLELRMTEPIPHDDGQRPPVVGPAEDGAPQAA